MANNNNKDSRDSTDDVNNIDNTDHQEEEEYDVDDILGEDGDESEDITEILKRSETLRDPDAEDSDSGTAEEDTRENAREAETKTEAEADLSDFLDELDEDEKAGKSDKNANTAPDLDNALAEFTDDSGEKKQDAADSEESEKEKKQKKIKLIAKISLISAVCVFVIAAGFMTWILIGKYTNSYIMTFYGRKISTNDFQFFLLNSMDDYSDPKEKAMESLSFYLAIIKGAKDRNIELTADEINTAKENAKTIKDQIDEYYPAAKKISVEFLEEMVGVEYLYYQLMEKIPEELGYKFDESEFAAALADYIENGKTDYISMDCKYILTETREAAEEAKEAVESGALSPNEAIRKFSVAHSEEDEETYGFHTLPLSEAAYYVPEEDLERFISLEVGDIFDIIKISDEAYVLFTPENVYRPSEGEIEMNFKLRYEDNNKYYMVMAEIDNWIEANKAGIKINEKALNNYDVEALFETTANNNTDSY